MDVLDIKACPYCGTKMVNTGTPIWEDYCPNDDCHGHRDEFFQSLAKEIDRQENLTVQQAKAVDAVNRLQAEIERLRPEYRSNSMLDHGRRQMLDHFESLLNGKGNVGA